MIEGARIGGYNYAARNVNMIGIENTHKKQKEVWEVLHEFPFDSTRKRMSYILRKRGDKEIVMMSKGADSIMLPRCELTP